MPPTHTPTPNKGPYPSLRRLRLINLRANRRAHRRRQLARVGHRRRFGRGRQGAIRSRGRQGKSFR